MKTVADTNILVYSLNKSSQFYQAFREYLTKERKNILIANQTLFEFLRIVTHPKFPNPLKMSEAIEHVELYKSLFHIIYETEKDIEVFKDLCTRYNLGSNRVFDTKLAATILNNGIKRLATINEADFKVFEEIEVVNPLEMQGK